ncbi:hypothetical protein OS493_004093 [Desmophyllum pertusum]|uniref:Uncharacterized protein n=1 Tax=Desmophyllum pertusum TaxID=174260 RepID=A0A9W9ZU39_9CNID|nr:hypothetical protein OS493_004093 [Desmophyllum pertusum]
MSLQCFTFRSETALRPKKVRKRKKKKECESRKANYLESTVTGDEGEINISTTSITCPMGENPTTNQKSCRAVSMESLPLRGRERAWSRVSTMHSDDFWTRHFGGNNLISWKCFRAAFLEDYGSMIHDFAPQRMHWILSIVHTDIFAAADNIHKLYYDKFCGKSEHPDRLWLTIKEYASERIFREGVIESMFE